MQNCDWLNSCTTVSDPQQHHSVSQDQGRASFQVRYTLYSQVKMLTANIQHTVSAFFLFFFCVSYTSKLLHLHESACLPGCTVCLILHHFNLLIASVCNSVMMLKKEKNRSYRAHVRKYQHERRTEPLPYPPCETYCFLSEQMRKKRRKRNRRRWWWDV